MKPNAPLLQRTLKHIKLRPDLWDQGVYRAATPCGTAMCFAGWACELAGGQWLEKAQLGLWEEYLVAVPEDDPRYVSVLDPPRIFALHRAKRILGLNELEADRLFGADNELSAIEEIVRDLCTKAEAIEREEKLRAELHKVDQIEPKGTPRS